MRALAFITFLLILSLSLGSCGQKGPLYMPEKQQEQQQEQ